MYYDYFGLKEAPFSIAPNPEYLFMTTRHQEALAHLYHGIKSDAGFVLLTGDIGTGKTTICRCFLSELPDNVAVAYILNPFLGGRELLMTICEELKINNVDKKSSLRALTQHIHERLLENHAKGLTTILLIDEAQHINLKVLELIRLLTNLETNKQKLLKIILVGQPELNEHLEKRELVQLAQRITARYHIKSLSLDEVSAYINYRLNIAGCIDGVNIFPPSIMKTLYGMTQGVPRVINALCDRALLGVYSQNKRQVDKKTLKTAIVEIKGQGNTNQRAPLLRGLSITLLLMAVALGSWFLSQYYHSKPLAVASLPSNTEISTLENNTVHEGQIIRDENVTDNLFAKVGYTDSDLALGQLISDLYIPAGANALSCGDIISLDWRCENMSDTDSASFTTINRPAIIHLLDESQSFYAPVVARRNQQLGFLQGDSILWVNLVSLEPLWSGEFIFLWQPPRDFDNYIYFDSNPDLINWLANAFSIIDGKSEPLAINTFNSLLKQRVSLFQEKNGLEVDGIAGRDTILRLNEALGVAKVLAVPESTDLPPAQTVFQSTPLLSVLAGR